MRMIEIIEKKRMGIELSEEEITFFVKGYVKNEIPDYQISALLMAIMFNPLSKDETVSLTKAMLESGKVNLFESGIYVDKHSTGGVSDSTSLIIVPLVCSCGLKFAKMSGYGLGHTGGTLDKLTTIPGYDVNISIERFNQIIDSVGCSIIGQTQDLVPADKKLYALRDVTDTVDSIGLIASSIMSKKLASGSDVVVLDVKVGNGAFMKNIWDAVKLAETMVEIGKSFSKNVKAVVTDMNQPLGDNIGCSLEVKEAIEILKGKRENRLKKLAILISSLILKSASKVQTLEEGEKICEELIKNGSAFEKFKEMVQAQGGDISYVEDENKLPLAKNVLEITSQSTGVINFINAKVLGECVVMLGGGRLTQEDIVDHSVGIVVHKKLGNFVKKGDKIFDVYYNKCIDEVINRLECSISIVDDKEFDKELIYKIIE